MKGHIMIIAIITLVLLLMPLSAFAQWANEPTSSTVLLDCSFDTSATCNGALWDVYGSAVLGSPTVAPPPQSPPSALRSILNPCTPNPGCAGGMELIYPANTAVSRPLKEIYVGLYWAANAQWTGNKAIGNKIFFIRAKNWLFGGTGTNGFFGSYGQPGNFPHFIKFGHNTGSLDNSHTCAADLGLICHNNVGATPIFPNTWYKIEAYVRASTCTTCRNGIVKWWVNGVLNGSYTNLNYGTNIVNEWVFAQTWDGHLNGCCPTQQWNFYVDHLHISAPNCQALPGGCIVDNPPGPPRPVTGVNVTVQ
jgi:hypothetical protein